MPVNTKNSNSKNLNHKKAHNVSSEKLVGGNDTHQEAVTQEATPQEASTHEATTQEATPQEASTHEATPQEASTQKASTQKATTQKAKKSKASVAVEPVALSVETVAHSVETVPTTLETELVAHVQVAGGNKKKSTSQKATVSKTSKDKTVQKADGSKTQKEGKSKAVVKQTKTSKKVDETDADEDGLEKSEKGVRSFKVQLPSDEVFAGRFTGLTPYQAANKALSKYFRENKTIKSEITFSIRESTRGSKRSTYVYSGKREKLGTPVKYSINGPDGVAREIVKEYKNKLTKVKKTASKEAAVSV